MSTSEPTTKPQPPSSWRVRMLVHRLRSEAEKSLGPRQSRAMVSMLRELMLRLPDRDLMTVDRGAIQRAGQEMQADGRSEEQLALLQRAITAFFDLAGTMQLAEGHPIRDGRVAYSGEPTGLLLIGVDQEHIPVIRRALRLTTSTSVDRENDIDRALDAIRWYPYKRIITGYPLGRPGLAKVLSEIRHLGSPSRRAGLVVLAPEAKLDEATSYRGRGCNQVVAEPSDLGAVFAGLDHVEPRTTLKVPMLISDSAIGTDVMAMWQTENISLSGLLVRTRARIEVGAAFGGEIRLPGDNRPLRLRAEVVRLTDHKREGLTGIAARFVQFEIDSHERLSAFMSSRTAD